MVTLNHLFPPPPESAKCQGSREKTSFVVVIQYELLLSEVNVYVSLLNHKCDPLPIIFTFFCMICEFLIPLELFGVFSYRNRHREDPVLLHPWPARHQKCADTYWFLEPTLSSTQLPDSTSQIANISVATTSNCWAFTCWRCFFFFSFSATPWHMAFPGQESYQSWILNLLCQARDRSCVPLLQRHSGNSTSWRFMTHQHKASKIPWR